MARRKQNNEPEKKGVDPGRFFAVAGKSEDNTNVEGKKGSAASRMAFSYDQRALDKRIDRKTRDLRDTVDTMRNLLLSISKDMRDLEKVATTKNKEDTKRAKEERYALVAVRGALFDVRGTLAGFSFVKLMESLQKGDMSNVAANIGAIATLMAPEIVNIATNVVTGALIGYGIIRGRGARVPGGAPRGAVPRGPAVPRTPAVPGGAGGLRRISLALKVLSLLGGGVLLGKALSGDDKKQEERLLRLLAQQSQQSTKQSALDEQNVNRFQNILVRFEQALDNLLRKQGVEPSDIDPSAITTKGAKKKPEPYKSNEIPDYTKDEPFLERVKIIADQIGIKPSQLLSLLSGESGADIDPRAQNKSGATGIFQLMFDPDRPEQKRYGVTREEMLNMSRAQQMDIYAQYLSDQQRMFGDIQGTLDASLAQLAPAFIGSKANERVYVEGSPEYEQNKGIDTRGKNLPGGKSGPDGVITAGEIREYFMDRQGMFTQYDKEKTETPPVSFVPIDMRPSAAPVFNDPGPIASAAGGENEIYSADNPHSHMRLNYTATLNLIG